MSDREKPEVKAMTQGVGQRPRGFPFDETVGLAGAASAADAAAASEMADHSLHASGQICARCGETLTADSTARRTVDGDWIHDTCPSRSPAR
jgi:hypothetical protein